MKNALPANLASLQTQEDNLRSIALQLIESSAALTLHVGLVEAAMDLADVFRQFDTDDEDLKVLQVLGMRMFNAFGSSLRLALSGYSQNSALVMQDILETVYLLDMLQSRRSLIPEWRFASDDQRFKKFAPKKVRIFLDKRDGFNSGKRAEHYKLFSDLAGHPNMKSDWMMRPDKNGDAVIGPFIEFTTLQAVISEMGRLAFSVGELVSVCLDPLWVRALPSRMHFTKLKLEWAAEFYGAGPQQ